MDKSLDLIPLNDWGYFQLPPRPCVVAGPCSAESPEQVMETAEGLKKIGINVFRAGIWKPRTHPGSFEGVGVDGLRWLQQVRRDLGMKVCTEVASQRHVFECIKYGVDMVWLGARTTANPFLVQEIAEALRDTDIPVLVKNPVNPDIDLWIGALERLNREGVRKLGVIQRGFSSFEKINYRNAPQWQVSLELRSRFPQLPFFCDPSHLAGDRKYILEISQKAMDLGLDGLMVESHCNPSCALSDARQQLTPQELIDMLHQIVVREGDSQDEDYRNNISALRARIDVLDESLIKILSERMDISRAIGRQKKEKNIAIVQASRWDEVLEKVVRDGESRGLDGRFVVNVFNAIHDASVSEQNKILEDK